MPHVIAQDGLTDGGRTGGGRVVAETVGEAFLLWLRARGVENFFLNAGTDFAPLVEAYAKLAAFQDQLPRPVIGAHEGLVMGMAHGAYLMTGRPQAVMFHVGVGTANAVCGAMNAAAERVPLLVCAGRSPLFERDRLGARNTRVAWAQEMYDQAAMLREFVKWDYELRGATQVYDVLDRALSLMMSEPRGSAYLTLPREVLAETQTIDVLPERAFPTVASPARPDPEAVRLLSHRLVTARMPVITSIAGGADKASVPVLARLCERFAIGYVEDQARYLNLPSDHPSHLGYSILPVLKDADVLCAVESDVPWVPDLGRPRPGAFVAHCGVDPNFSRYPIRTHRSDLNLTASPSDLYLALEAELETRRGDIDPGRSQQIIERAAAVRRAQEASVQAEAAGEGPITNAFLSAAVGRILDDDCIVFNEYWAAKGLLDLRRPGSYFHLPATGGLGWALPAAIGAKFAAPGKSVIATVGDGAYMFANPVACHHAIRKHAAPVLTVICNNARWNAVESTARMAYPAGHIPRQPGLIPLADLTPVPDYEKICEASGGYGVLVSRREDLDAALRKAFDMVRSQGRQAVLNVICA
jgi:acetolactate synthase I/II/III large subunit